MQELRGRIWKWRQRIAYRLLARSEMPGWDAAAGEAAPVRLDFPDCDIWLRATSAPERRWRARACAKEPWTVRWIQESIQPGEVLYDIGANVGAFSLIAALSRGASVVAFEPGYANFARLCENIQLNACAAAIVPVPFPLSDAAGLLTFYYRSVEPGQSRHTLGESQRQTERRGRSSDRPESLETAPPASPYAQPVCATTLDRAVADFTLPAPHHLKIDVDGSELRVLRGGAAVLRGPQLRSILIESDAGASDALASELIAAGFTLQARHERPRKPEAPAYAVWVR